MKTRAKMYRGQYRAVEDALESWKVDHEEAMGVCDLEEVIRVCLQVQSAVAEMVKLMWKKGFSGEIRDPEEVGQYVRKALDAGVLAWSAIREGAEECAAAGYDVEGANGIPAALAEVTAARDDFARRWPFFRRGGMERGAKEIAEGRFITGEELLRELHSQGS